MKKTMRLTLLVFTLSLLCMGVVSAISVSRSIPSGLSGGTAATVTLNFDPQGAHVVQISVKENAP